MKKGEQILYSSGGQEIGQLIVAPGGRKIGEQQGIGHGGNQKHLNLRQAIPLGRRSRHKEGKIAHHENANRQSQDAQPCALALEKPHQVITRKHIDRSDDRENIASLKCNVWCA